MQACVHEQQRPMRDMAAMIALTGTDVLPKLIEPLVDGNGLGNKFVVFMAVQYVHLSMKEGQPPDIGVGLLRPGASSISGAWFGLHV